MKSACTTSKKHSHTWQHNQMRLQSIFKIFLNFMDIQHVLIYCVSAFENRTLMKQSANYGAHC